MAEEKIVLNKQLFDYLRTYVRDLNLADPEFYVTRACNKGDNFVGLVYCVKIEGIENGKAKSIHVILKTPKLDIPANVVTQPMSLYEREIFFYQEVLPIFKDTLKKHGGIADLFPTFYGANDEPGKEVLILENLMVEGFTMKSSRIMDYPHVSLALRCLGKFHAYSFITRAADPISFDKLKQMKEPLFSRNSHEKDEYIINVCNIVGKALIGEKKHYLERYKQFTDNIISNLNDVIDGNAAEPYAVVNHGDVWTNNILYKYDQKSQECSQEKRPCDLRFLDFQICRYASPVLDIVYLLFCCCTQEMRSKYYDQLIDEYYETLSKYLEKCGYNSNILFPYEALSKHLIKFGKYAAGMAIFTLHIFTDDKGEYTDMTSALDYKQIEEKVQNDNFYRYMIQGTFKDLVDKNYI